MAHPSSPHQQSWRGPRLGAIRLRRRWGTRHHPCPLPPCTYAPLPAPYGVFNSDAISVVCFLRFSLDWSSGHFLCAVRHRQSDAEQLRPRRQHEVRYGSSDYCNSSRWLWFPRYCLGRMVLQIPKTTRYSSSLRLVLFAPTKILTLPDPERWIVLCTMGHHRRDTTAPKIGHPAFT